MANQSQESNTRQQEVSKREARAHRILDAAFRINPALGLQQDHRRGYLQTSWSCQRHHLSALENARRAVHGAYET